MQFRLEKVGPVDAANLELGDLTLIAGQNNTGKTYVVYALYGFLRTWLDYGVDSYRRSSRKFPLAEFLDELQAHWAARSDATVCIPRKDLETLRSRILRISASGFSRVGISRTFSAPREAFAESSLAVHNGKLPSGLEEKCLHRDWRGEISAIYGEDEVRLELRPAEDPPDRRSRFEPHRLLAKAAVPDMPDPFILSAERFGISLFYKELDFTKNRLVEMLQQLGDEKKRGRDSPYLVVDRIASRYAMPVKDNIDYTRSIPELRGRVRVDSASLDSELKELMDGYYAASDGDIRFRSKARKGRTFDIPLHLASSSARGLSDLYFYLRHKASENHLLIVDEPESHLDTANQIQFARVLARFVKAGIKVLVTTHSDYLIKEINNLIMLTQVDKDVRRRLGRQLGYAASEGLSKDSVRAYIAENQGLTPCVVDRYGLEMPVFDETIDKINRVSNALSAAIYQTE